MSLVHFLDYPTLPQPLLRVGDYAPDVELQLGPTRTRLHRWGDGAWVVLFTLHDGDPLDRAAEARRLAALLPDFRARFVKLLGVATSPAGIEDNLPLPVADDRDGEVTSRYRLNPAARSAAVIDPEYRVRLLLGYPPRRERDFAEVLRLITALQQVDARERADRSNWRTLQAATLGAW
jgi:alkyl hydroperoxide reductase subunit AhpC